MLEKYISVFKCGQAEIIEKKSRFIASVSPVENEQDTLEFINNIKKKYYNANHNVFAYQIGEKNEIQRQSDDGEPSGTAGKPVLDVLKGEDIKNTVIVVTRYFGGTLLGTGGLVKAYGQCAKKGIVSAGLCENILYKTISVKVGYELSGKIEYYLMNEENIIKDKFYTDNVEFVIFTKFKSCEKTIKSITEITSGKALIKQGEDKYIKFVDGNAYY